MLSSSLLTVYVLCVLSLGFTDVNRPIDKPSDKKIEEAITECDQNTANLQAIKDCVVDKGPEGLLDDDYYDSIINLTDVCLPFNANLRKALVRYKEKRDEDSREEIDIRDAILLRYFKTLDGLLCKAGIEPEDYQKYKSVRI